MASLLSPPPFDTHLDRECIWQKGGEWRSQLDAQNVWCCIDILIGQMEAIASSALYLKLFLKELPCVIVLFLISTTHSHLWNSSNTYTCLTVCGQVVCLCPGLQWSHSCGTQTLRDPETKLPGSRAQHCHMVSQLGGEARAQVTCFCAASWAVTDPSLNYQAAHWQVALGLGLMRLKPHDSSLTLYLYYNS